jgi:hypothetical protein
MTRADLIARVESAERPTQSLFVEAFKVQFGADPEEPGVGKQYRLFVYSGAYLDAAMMLVESWMDARDIATLFAEAFRACERAKVDPRQHLSRFLVAACLRAGGE